MKENMDAQTSSRSQREKDVLKGLYALEDLTEKKLSVYARLLTDVNLAKDMEGLAKKHAERKMRLQTLAMGVAVKENV